MYNPRTEGRPTVTDSPTSLRFREMAARAEADVDLAEAALLIAGDEYPDLDVARYLARLDRLGTALRERAAGAGVDETVDALNRLLFEEEGFHGNTESYYDPRNSFLNDVLDRRT